MRKTNEEYARERREYLRSRQRCVWCGERDAYTMNGRSLCSVCAEKNADRARQRRARRRDELNEEAREKTARFLDAGGCRICGKPTYAGARKRGTTFCLYHWRLHAVRGHRYWIQTRTARDINWPRGDNGICWLCNKAPAAPGFKICPACYRSLMLRTMKTRGRPAPANHPWRRLRELDFQQSRYYHQKRQPAE